ncbi:MAG: EamA family transporter [Oscillospiraceae bacterium]|nr:EamA family transporter [Oscillospiraceae bacterium]
MKSFNTKYKISGAAILCNLLWGSAYPGIKIGYELFNITDSVPQKLFFAGLRFVLAGIMVLFVSIPVNKRLPRLDRNNIGIITITGVIYTAMQYVFFYIGLSNTSGSNGSIVNSTTTFMAIIVAKIFFKERIGLMKALGTLIGFAGVIVILSSGSAGGFSFHGEGFILIAAMCFVAGSLISKKAAASSDAMTATGFNLLIGGVILLFSGLVSGGRLVTISAGGILVLLYLAFLSAAAFTIWTFLLKEVSVGRISIFNFLIPVSGTILSAIFMKENIWDIHYLVSLILVCAGICLVNHENKSFMKN